MLIRLPSILVVALLGLLLVAVSGCAEENAAPVGTTAGPTRDSAESLDDALLRQQGSAGPCAGAWQQDLAAYWDWQNSVGSYDAYVAADQRYQECVRVNGYVGDGPISESGPSPVDHQRPQRNPGENAHDYRMRQQGQIGPCGYAWQSYDTSYDQWMAGQVTAAYYQQAAYAYQQCVEANYPH